MYDKCIYDRDNECLHDCPSCPKCEKPEPDWDSLRDIYRDESEPRAK